MDAPEALLELRQLTVFFCDLVESVSLTNRMDVEELHALLLRYQQKVAACVTHAGGVVARFQGDAVLAYFGYPHMSETDAEKAVRCALSVIGETSALGLQCRIGIATGTVLVAPDGDNRAADRPPIVGQAPNLASRLQSIAAPGQIVIDDATRSLVGGLFAYEDLGTLAVKGYSEPLRASRVCAESGDDDRLTALRGPALPLVGRRKEYRRLTSKWHEARSGSGACVIVSGEAGIGKSRLVSEFERRLKRKGTPVFRIHGSPIHQNSPLVPFAFFMQRMLRRAQCSTPAEKISRLRSHLVEAGLDAEATLPALADLLAIPLEDARRTSVGAPENQRALLLDTLARFVLRESETQPVLVIVEDIHWLDPTSLEVAQAICSRLAQHRLLLIATQRETSKGLSLAPSPFHLALPRLSADDTVQLVRAILQTPGATSSAAAPALPDAFVAQIAERAEGVPLFAQELTRAVMAGAASRTQTARGTAPEAMPLGLPVTLMGLLQSRIDAAGAPKALLRICAALGTEFSTDMLPALAGCSAEDVAADLKQLKVAHLVEHVTDTSYRFRHALIRDAAYAMLLKTERHSLHKRIASVLAERYADLIDAHPELLAHHQTEADLIGDAVRTWLLAGQRAATRSANVEAARLFTRGLDLLKRLPANDEAAQMEFQLLIALGPVQMAIQGYGAEAAQQTFARARVLAAKFGNDAEYIRVLWGLWNAQFGRGELLPAKAIAETMVEVADRNGTGGAIARRILGQTLSCIGEHNAACEALKMVVAGRGRTNAEPIRIAADNDVVALVYLARSLWVVGKLDEAGEAAQAAIARAQDLRQPLTTVVERVALGAWRMRIPGIDQDAAMARARETINLCAAHGLGYLEKSARFNLGAVLANGGELQRGIIIMREAYEAADRMQTQLVRPMRLGLMAATYLRLDDGATASRLLGEALEAVEQTGEREYTSVLHRIRGDLLEQSGDRDGALEAWRMAIAVAEQCGYHYDRLQACVLLAISALKQGHAGPAREALHSGLLGIAGGEDDVSVRQAKALLHKASETTLDASADWSAFAPALLA